MSQINNRYTGKKMYADPNLSVRELAEKNKANLSGADLSGADLYRTNLFEANLSRANLYGANLSGADLSGADLSNANLYGADLSGADLSGADLFWVNLSRVNLSRVNLYGADLYGADLSWADLYGADLRRADLRWANLSGVNLSGANLRGVNFTGTILDPTNIPNQQCSEFEKYVTRSGQVWCVGYRTKNSPHLGGPGYEEGETYVAPWFSTGETDCHPGIFVLPSIELAKKWGDEIVKVWFKEENCHKTSSKWRVSWLWVECGV